MVKRHLLHVLLCCSSSINPSASFKLRVVVALAAAAKEEGGSCCATDRGTRSSGWFRCRSANGGRGRRTELQVVECTLQTEAG